MSGARLTLIKKGNLIKVGGIERWVGVKHVRRLDIELEDQLTYQQKASCHDFGYQARRIRYFTKEIGCCRG